MSQETLQWLNANVLIGMTSKRGHAWHYRASSQGPEPNHYPGFIPAADVQRRLFHWQALPTPEQYTIPATPADANSMDEHGNPTRQITVTDQVIYRSDTGEKLHTFGPGYSIHQHSEVLLDGLADILTPDGLAVTADSLGIGSAGLLRNGAIAWVQVEIPDTVTTPQGVDFRPYLSAIGSHNGSLSTTFITGHQLVLCDNTMFSALAEARRQRFRHTKHSIDRLLDTRHALGLIVESAEEFASEIALLCAADVTDREFALFRDAWAPRPESGARAQSNADTKRDALTHLYFRDSRVTPWTGTAFGVLQAVNTWSHHVQGGVTTPAARAARNMRRAIHGTTAQTDAGALHLLDTIRTA